MRDIINNGEEIIGKVSEVIEYFKDEMIKQIKRINIFGEYIECNDIEDRQNNLDLILDLINGLYQDYITETIEDDTLIKVILNSMGVYQYTIYKEMGNMRINVRYDEEENFPIDDKLAQEINYMVHKGIKVRYMYDTNTIIFSRENATIDEEDLDTIIYRNYTKEDLMKYIETELSYFIDEKEV